MLDGTAGSQVGINVAGNRSDIVVRNGIIRGWAIGISHFSVNNARYEHLHVVANTSRGIGAGDRAQVANCHVVGNGNVGLELASHASVIDTAVMNNSGSGIDAEDTALVDRCVVRGNTGNGIDVGHDATVRHCTVTDNSGTAGIRTGDGATVTIAPWL